MDYGLRCLSTYLGHFQLLEKAPLTEIVAFRLCPVRGEDGGCRN